MLKIRIFSFSYLRSGIPKDETPNGGGFVFDCRFILNPGSHLEFMPFTGKDKPVWDFLECDKEMEIFLKNVCGIIDAAVKKYLSRDFTDLMISFGCTGGQHRSVYAAEKLKNHIEQSRLWSNKDVSVVLKHLDIP